MNLDVSNLKFLYDSKLAGVILRFARSLHGDRAAFTFYIDSGTKIGSDLSQPAQMLQLESGQLHVLLGRNGAGKTRLLQGLVKSLSDDVGYPSASLMFTVPDKSQHESWREMVEAVSRTDWFHQMSEYGPEDVILDETTSPPLMEKIRQCFDVSDDSNGIPALAMTFDEVLDFFGCSESEVEDWKNRRSHRFVVPSGIPGPHGPWDWQISHLVPEFLLRGCQTLPHNTSTESVSVPWENEELLAAAKWLNDPELRGLVVPAIREFLATVTHVEIVHGGAIRLLAPFPSGGALAQMLHLQSNVEMKSWIRVPFPEALFGVLTMGSRSWATSYLLPATTGSVVEVVDASPADDVHARLNDEVRNLIGSFLDFRLARGATSTALEISGLDNLGQALDRLSTVVAHCGIGVAEVRADWPPEGGWMALSADGLPSFVLGEEVESWSHSRSGVPTSVIPQVKWRDASIDEWLSIEQASEGQKQVLALLFRLASIGLFTENESRRHVLVVSDEFDRNLHPQASTSVLEAVYSAIQEVPNLTVLMSSHSIAALSRPTLRGVSRIFAARTIEGFQYLEAADSGLEVMAEVLGASFLDVLRLKRLHVLLEGSHDEFIISDLLEGQIPAIRDIDLVNGQGLYGWSGIFATSLRFLDAPVLLVHDKRNQKLEDEWRKVQETFAKTRRLPDWGSTGLARMLTEIKQRKSDRSWKKGDGELEKLLWFLKNNAFERDHAQVERIFIFGLDCDDIVDLLPIASFPKAATFSNWQDAHAATDVKNPFAGGEAFKAQFGINIGSVKRAMDQNRDAVHPEFGRLIQEVRRFLEIDEL